MSAMENDGFDTGTPQGDLDFKINLLFPGVVVRKDLVKAVKGNAIVPTYVLEYLLGQYAASNVNGRDFLVSGTMIGLYSLPEIVKKTDNPAENKVWTLDDLDKQMPSVVGELVNQWPRKEEKPA